MKALGVRAAIIDIGSGMARRYLSEEYFELVRVAVAEAKKRDMRLWIMDDGDYPSGMAGGKITVERPDLGMQVLAEPERIAVDGGARFERKVGPDFICAAAVNTTDRTARVLEPAGGKIEWTAPQGRWEIILARRQFRTSPTRAAYNESGAKDTTYSLIDYLNPSATAVFLDWTFDGYRRAIGDELGRTVLGFRGDEPAYTLNPWTPALLSEFQRRKGYDLRPYLVAFGPSAARRGHALTRDERLAFGDYCDVWSDLFRDNYFDKEAGWCAAHGVEMQLHIEHEDMLPQLATADGDFFKALRHIQVPGVDTIWHQLWMDNPADFPKLASSAAHLFGHPRSMCEAFAAYRPQPNLRQARWIVDFLLSRGVTRIEYMYYRSSASRRQGPNAGSVYYRDPGFPAVAASVDRLGALLGEGRPAAQIGLFLPSSSFWIADPAGAREVNGSLLRIAHELISLQRDFDFVDEQSLSSVLELRGNELVNLSGQGYRAIVVPPSLAISRAALNRLRAFAEAGGRVIFVGAAPALVVDRDFLHARGPAEVGWATYCENSFGVTPGVLSRLPEPDVQVDRAAPLLSVLHRRLRDAQLYFLFNSGDEPLSLVASLEGSGSVQSWDSDTGRILPFKGEAAGPGRVRVPVALEPWSTLTLVVGGTAPADPAVASPGCCGSCLPTRFSSP